MSKRVVLKVLGYEALGLAIIAALVGLFFLLRWLAPMWASLSVIQYARAQAGDPVVFSDEYTYNDVFRRWDQYSNSDWLIDYSRLIVPYFAYENIRELPLYPSVVMWIPYPYERSFHVGGTTYLNFGMITINERYLLDERWNDQREVLGVLVHELAHVQGGYFIPADGIGPEDYESNTQAATWEVLAAMCNYGDKLACKTFWFEMEGMARTRLMIQLKDAGFRDKVYQRIANVLWRDNVDEMAARKAARYWSGNESEKWYIIRAYSEKPYKKFLKGLNGEKLDTGNLMIGYDWKPYHLFMSFDDSLDLIPGWIRTLLYLSTF